MHGLDAEAINHPAGFSGAGCGDVMMAGTGSTGSSSKVRMTIFERQPAVLN